jgi:DNA-binding response OmpR family regulator
VSRRILVVDTNEAFAKMLLQSLEEMNDTQANSVPSGKEALRATATTEYDLVIVDLQLPDVEGPLLVRTLRQEHPHLPLVVIPAGGDEAPPELADVDIQGTLPKPFFLPELPGRIQAALSGSARAEPAVEQTPAADEDVTSQVTHTLSRLAQEVTAEAVLLTRGGELLFQVGRLPEEEVVALAAVISDSWRTSARVAQILGKEQLRFEQSIEGAQHLLYSLALADELILSVVVEGRMPLGMIRHRVKEAAEAIRELMGA